MSSTIKKLIILDAGHSLNSPGACFKDLVESSCVIKICERLIPLLQRSFDVFYIDDHFSLEDSIKEANKKVSDLDDGLALSIHLNAGGGSGAEAYYFGSDRISGLMCKKFIDRFCSVTNLKNRGAKSDKLTRFGRLGWIRDVKCWSFLLECCFIDNTKDMEYLSLNYDEVAFAIYTAICDLFGVKCVDEHTVFEFGIDRILKAIRHLEQEVRDVFKLEN